MIPVLTAAEMKEADRRTIEEIGLPGVVLMENAGAAVARAVRETFPAARRVVVLCGKGNNGGDGFVVARRLRDLRPETLLFASREEVRGDARTHMGAFERSGGTITEVTAGAAWERVRAGLASTDVVVDALLGTGLRQKPSGLIGEVVADLARIAEEGVSIVAVDIPSGIPSDTGETPWPAPRAALTVTFAAPKYGHVLPPACDRVGRLVVADIGITAETLGRSSPRLHLLEGKDAAAVFPPRAPGAHKGGFGHVLVIAGSVGKTGAALLAATGALRAGAGLVTVATSAPALPLVAAGRAELMTEPLPAAPTGGIAREAVDRALSLAKDRDAVVLGPGLGQDPGTRHFVREFVGLCPVALLIDADGLNALAAAPELRSPAAREALRRSAPTVVTPHPGEMARLAETGAAEVQKRRLETARGFALETGAFVVLKGQRTLVAEPGGRAAVNPTGNPGMATGGTGDVLSGMIGALLARSEPWAAATAGAYLHGLAGDRAAARMGAESLVAGDLLEALPEAIREVTHS